MSRPILSRPRTRVYGCNYDKGESYYKPMVDHLDRKYSARPLFSEPRNSLADEIAARRGDIGTRDFSGPRQSPFGRDLDLETDPSVRATSRLPLPFLATVDNPFPAEDEDIVYDSRGQRGRRFAENFANDVAATTQHLKTKIATAVGFDDEKDDFGGFGVSRHLRQEQDRLKMFSTGAKDVKSLSEEAETTFKRRSKLFDEIDAAPSSLTKWTKMLGEDEASASSSAAATRAKRTKARLNDLESEMEELADRQAKRERRAAALRALINENAAATADIDNIQERSAIVSKKVTIRSEHADKHVTF
ncbi:uncharacterized protein LOC108627422 [Ceratina calcarata]|uniref:Uncharacterized protein LOC108627422 n=1 Tax=Ceratina calcarata TaxID=156304 RepID=A0AAJ7J4R7_9HYME|nr:uncharacterized protein LOC108627422 [Ceratina calcarata]XP_026671374.1 uncharacterized protein LOC108627422 [Ceratina calcarata]